LCTTSDVVRYAGSFWAVRSEHPDVTITLSTLAEVYFAQGRYTEAEPLYQRALRIDEKALGRDDRSLLAVKQIGTVPKEFCYQVRAQFDAHRRITATSRVGRT
jgi:tetratricopeptide (TPR) repeat protein